MLWCPRCKGWRESAHVGARMNMVNELPYWEVEKECLRCKYRIWIPCKKEDVTKRQSQRRDILKYYCRKCSKETEHTNEACVGKDGRCLMQLRCNNCQNVIVEEKDTSVMPCYERGLFCDGEDTKGKKDDRIYGC